MKRSPDAIIVLLEHPHGNVEVSLRDWEQSGPGARKLVRPIDARDAVTGEKLGLGVIPLPLRNSVASRWLIKFGVLKNPWKT